MDTTETAQAQLRDAATGLWQEVEFFLTTLLAPWRVSQVVGIIAIACAAWLLARLLSPYLRRWLRNRQGWPKWRLRAGLMVDQRLSLVLFMVMAWIVVIAMRAITWPSRSQLIALSATIATALLIISFASRLIANRLLRRVVRWAAWVWVVLYYMDLLEPASALLDSVGMDLGKFRLSALTLFKALAIMTAMIMGARLLSKGVTRRLAANEDITPTMRVLVGKLVQVLLFTIAIVAGLRAAGFDLTGLAVFSGAVGVGLGFGLQKVVSNLVSGVIILLDKSVKPGDVISIGDTFGWIDELGARYVSVVTRDGKEYLIPNEDMVTSQVVNWSHTNDFVRLDVHFGTAYRDDPHVVSKLAINAAMTVKRVLAQRTPVCWITGFGDHSVEYVLRFWISDAQGGLTNVRGQVYLALWDSFKENGITLPYPQREVRLLNDSIAVGSPGDIPAPPQLIAD